jgi:hypothetical protein
MKISRRIKNQDRIRSRTTLCTGQDNDEKKHIAFNLNRRKDAEDRESLQEILSVRGIQDAKHHEQNITLENRRL